MMVSLRLREIYSCSLLNCTAWVLLSFFSLLYRWAVHCGVKSDQTVEGIRKMINKGSHVSVNARELADMFAELQELRRGARGAQPQQQKPPIYNRAALTDADARLKRLEMEKAEFQGTNSMDEILACAFRIQNLPFRSVPAVWNDLKF